MSLDTKWIRKNWNINQNGIKSPNKICKKIHIIMIKKRKSLDTNWTRKRIDETKIQKVLDHQPYAKNFILQG